MTSYEKESRLNVLYIYSFRIVLLCMVVIPV